MAGPAGGNLGQPGPPAAPPAPAYGASWQQQQSAPPTPSTAQQTGTAANAVGSQVTAQAQAPAQQTVSPYDAEYYRQLQALTNSYNGVLADYKRAIPVDQADYNLGTSQLQSEQKLAQRNNLNAAERGGFLTGGVVGQRAGDIGSGYAYRQTALQAKQSAADFAAQQRLQAAQNTLNVGTYNQGQLSVARSKANDIATGPDATVAQQPQPSGRPITARRGGGVKGVGASLRRAAAKKATRG